MAASPGLRAFRSTNPAAIAPISFMRLGLLETVMKPSLIAGKLIMTPSGPKTVSKSRFFLSSKESSQPSRPHNFVNAAAALSLSMRGSTVVGKSSK